MLADEDNTGLLAIMVGLIVLVFAGVGLSMLADRRFSFSNRVSTLGKLMQDERQELENLKDIHHAGSLKLAEIEPLRRSANSSKKELGLALANLARRRDALEAERGNLQKSTTVMEQEFVRYRSKYRERVRAEAVGQSLNTLTLRGGREYRNAVISKITDIGMEIRHENGTARLQATDLDASMQDRFQWDDESRRERLKEEQAAHASAARMSEFAEPKLVPHPGLRLESVRNRGNLDEVETLRARVIGWKSKIVQVRQQRDQALSAAYGSRSTTTGSLETWEQKAARLGKELARLEGALAGTMADLARIAPNDPLLRRNPDTR